MKFHYWFIVPAVCLLVAIGVDEERLTQARKKIDELSRRVERLERGARLIP